MTIKNALSMAATSASTSYTAILSAEELKLILQSGKIPAEFEAHIMTLLEEVPEVVVLGAVNQAATSTITTEKIMTHLSKWADQWHLAKWTRKSQ